MPPDSKDTDNKGSATNVTAGATDAAGTTANQTPPADQTPPASWEDILATLPDEQKTLYEQHTTKLRNAVQATRQERDDLQKRLGDITAALGKDPEAAKKLLDETSAQLELATRRAEFAEQAIRPEIGCTNPAAAFAVAQSQGLFDARGNPNWDALKAAVPELFRKPPSPAGNAGAGTGAPPPAAQSMDEIIRAKMRR